MNKNNLKQIALSLVTVMVLTACGGGGGSTSPIKGQLIDAPVANITYICNGGKTGKTDDSGAFSCEKLPVSFFVGNIELGSIETMNSNFKVYPQDIAGVNRDDFFDDYSMRISYLLQALDTDGDISETIDIDESVIVSDKKNLKLLSYVDIDKILEESGKTPLALEDVRTHLMDNANHDVDTTKGRDQQSVNLDTKALSLGELSNVTSNLTFPTRGEHESTISYVITNGTSISSTGEVVRPSFIEQDQTVTIVATIIKGEAKKSKSFRATVKALAISDVEAITLAEKDLKIAGTLSAVDSNLELVPTGLHGVTVSWVSSSTVVSSEGVVSRPSFTEGNADVQLTATLTKGSETRTKTFTLTVLKLPVSDAESVENVKDSLALANLDALRENVILPTSIDGVTLTWSSSDGSVISNSGVIFPSNYIGADKTATLIATLTKGEVTESKEFSVTVLKVPMTDAEKVALDKRALDLGDTSAVTSSLTLATTGSQGSTISWSSSDASVVSNTGDVIQATYTVGDKTVTLTATITHGAVSETREFTVTVLAYAMTDTEAVALAKPTLDLGDTSNVTSNLTLVTTLTNGVTVVWSSSLSSVVSTTGTVVQPTYTQGNQTVTLVATLSKGSVSEIKEFVVLVPALAMSDVEAVALAEADLDLGDVSEVTINLSLPTIGLYGTTVTYSSSDIGVVSNTGVITRPSYVLGDVSVTLIATITKNGVSEIKEFTLTIKKSPAITSDVNNLAVYPVANPIIRTYGDYTFEVRTDGIAPTESTKLNIVFFGKTSVTGLEKSDTITFALHGEYASGTNFQLVIKNTNGEIVVKSELLNFTTGEVAIDFGTLQVP